MLLATPAGRSIVCAGAGPANARRRLNFPPLFDFAVIRLPAAYPVESRMTKTTWVEWQRDVVAILQREFREVLHHISLEDVDWAAWRSFYVEGKSASAAVDRALERDL